MKKKTKRGHNITGAKIRQARLRLDPPVSQFDLAGKLAALGLDMDRPTITRIENQERYIRDYELKFFAKALKVSVAWLFGDEK